jgi:hypothetical protein
MDKQLLNKLFLFFFIFLSFKNFSQNLTDRIFPKTGDSIICRITAVEKNWIHYDFQGKKKLSNKHIYMDDVRYYVRNDIKRKPHEEDPQSNSVSDTPRMDHSKGPKDTIAILYLDKQGNTQSCSVLLSKNKAWRDQRLRSQLDVLDLAGKETVLQPDQIGGFWLEGTFYKSFNMLFNAKKIGFFAAEIVSGKASLYTYNGESLTGDPIFIFKKQTEKEFNFAYQNFSVKTTYLSVYVVPQSNGTSVEIAPMTYDSEELFLNFFQNYFSDCNSMVVKFKNQWYTSNTIQILFKDYNSCK